MRVWLPWTDVKDPFFGIRAEGRPQLTVGESKRIHPNDQSGTQPPQTNAVRCAWACSSCQSDSAAPQRNQRRVPPGAQSSDSDVKDEVVVEIPRIEGLVLRQQELEEQQKKLGMSVERGNLMLAEAVRRIEQLESLVNMFTGGDLRRSVCEGP